MWDVPLRWWSPLGLRHLSGIPQRPLIKRIAKPHLGFSADLSSGRREGHDVRSCEQRRFGPGIALDGWQTGAAFSADRNQFSCRGQSQVCDDGSIGDIREPRRMDQNSKLRLLGEQRMTVFPSGK